MPPRRARPTARGFTLVEALIAILVLSFGALAIGGLQIALWRNADLAKQRTEATRLAQQKIEELRSFEARRVAVGGFAYADLAGGTDAPPTDGNAEFTRRWALAGAAGDPQRRIDIEVAWLDREGQPQRIALASVIAAADPAEAGSLGVQGAGRGILRRPHARQVNLPQPTVSLIGTGKSYAPWGGAAGGFLLFSDRGGELLAWCGSAPTATTATSNDPSCTALVAYLLTGYIGGALPAAENLPSLLFDQTADLAAPPECVTSAAADQNAGYAAIPGLRFYRCLLQPTDGDGDPRTPPTWSGRVRLGGLAPGSPVCRYTPDAATTLNAEHPERYAAVGQSLDNQNYFIGACPAGSVPHPSP